MSRPVLWTAILLFLIGSGAFAYKVLALGMPIQPDRSARVWRVEMSVSVAGQADRGRIELQIPESDDAQLILDEQSYDDGLSFEKTTLEDGRVAIWRGEVGESQHLSYTFRVHLPEGSSSILRDDSDGGSDEAARAEERIPASIARTVERLRLTDQGDPDAIVASAFGFVAFDIETVPGATDDARLALRLREASEIGKSRLLVALLRGAGVEARLAKGIRLSRGGRGQFTHFVEARTRLGWKRLLTSEKAPGDFPEDFVRIAAGSRPSLSTTGVDASQVEIRMLRESLQPTEIASLVAPASPFWRALSLYRLPVETQATLEILLLLPIAVLVAAIFRNLIGLRTFGVFMPILIALSLRSTDLVTGLALVTSVTCAGVLGRLMLDRLRLLFVPRLCLLLCLVVLLITGLAQVGYVFEGRGFMSGLLFPIVILSILIERISVTTLEEGLESTQKLLAGSLALAAIAYPIFHSETLIRLFFGFPELVFCVMSGLVLIGGYRGYRLVELWRFRSLASPEAEPAK